jgi:serine/threonine protein kinase/tetratricopeptide (TPR) repeat protein
MNAEEILLAAVEKKTPAERAAYLDGACGPDADLRAEVEDLLQAHEAAGNFLEQPLFKPTPTVDQPPNPEGPGAVIGPYKLLEQIGEGGMGLVFMAEQTQPVRRRIALKILKPGMDTRQVVARFEGERQALAMMDHPHIAKIHDGGTTATGRPYFVMELVRGVPITEFCDQRRLPTRQRLGLFVTVCQAVQHAHQKGIIHRDLKPSNVLVTLHDTVAVPKVIDFGIAKARTGPLTERTQFTQFAQVLGTPLYMSPEQAEMNGLDVDTRSDVYSLGVLLYELLTGTTPFESQTLKQVGLDEIRRIIREKEPPTPSQRLNTLDAQACSTVSERRGVDARRLGQVLRGELDWVVMKALEKDRNRRYESASAFAADVQRYLNDEAVVACPPSAGYRLRKYVRRNRGPMLAAGLVLLALVGGFIGTTWGLVRAVAAERDAITERDAKEKARQDEAQQHREADANFRHALDGVSYLMGRLEGPSWPTDPLLQRARQTLSEHALEFYRGFLKDESDDPSARQRTAEVYINIASLFQMRGDHSQTEQNLWKAISIYAQAAGDDPENPLYQLGLATSHNILGLELQDRGEFDKATVEFVQALEFFHNARQQAPEHQGLLTSYAWSLGVCPDSKLRDAELGLALAGKLVEKAPESGMAWNIRGLALYRAGDFPAALEALKRAVGLHAGGDSVDWFLLAMAYYRLGRQEEGRLWYDRALQWRADKNRVSVVELRLLRNEAAELFGITEKKP